VHYFRSFFLEETYKSKPKEEVMDTFFTQENCDRCGKSLKDGRIMSMFNKDCLCLECKEEETKRPDYKEALDTERREVLKGERNFKGIGLK